jgi:outer membrane receptor protein involved in Fe transport
LILLAGSKLNAGYVMLDNKYKDFRLVWGARFENFVQTLNTDLEESTEFTEKKSIELNKKQNDFLPSVNLIYAVSKKQNLRLSFSKTLNRPEFRELAPFGFDDFTTRFFTQGNDSLQIAKINNYDFRYEIYPGKGQLFSFSYFRKEFTNPIEIQKQLNNNTVEYKNAKTGESSGIELEFRTLLSSIFPSEKTRIFDDITLFSNIAIIKSNVEDYPFIDKVTGEEIPYDKRPLQGQSPYVINAGIQYMNPDNGWIFSANLNRAGSRLYIGAGPGDPAIWEKARTFLDMQIAKNLMNNKLEIKLNVQNILAQDQIFYFKNTDKYVEQRFDVFEAFANTIFTGDYENKNGYSPKGDDTLWVTKYGRSFSLSLTYNF